MSDFDFEDCYGKAEVQPRQMILTQGNRRMTLEGVGTGTTILTEQEVHKCRDALMGITQMSELIKNAINATMQTLKDNEYPSDDRLGWFKELGNRRDECEKNEKRANECAEKIAVWVKTASGRL